MKEDAPGHGVIGDEGDDLEPAAAVGACEDVHGEDLLQAQERPHPDASQAPCPPPANAAGSGFNLDDEGR